MSSPESGLEGSPSTPRLSAPFCSAEPLLLFSYLFHMRVPYCVESCARGTVVEPEAHGPRFVDAGPMESSEADDKSRSKFVSPLCFAAERSQAQLLSESALLTIQPQIFCELE